MWGTTLVVLCRLTGGQKYASEPGHFSTSLAELLLKKEEILRLPQRGFFCLCPYMKGA